MSQSSVTEGASKAVDGKPETCAKTTVETNPWWSVDLGKDIWVKRIRINATMGSSLDIRIGKILLGITIMSGPFDRGRW